jgi:dTDP-4-amino-4,6-dideoxygalactose transaminase
MKEYPFLNLKKLHQEIGHEMRAAVDRALYHGQYINGPEVGEFERQWAGYCETVGAVGVSNGTSALHAILTCLEIGEGDEVILPSHTFIATAESILQTGATPVFAEIDEKTMLVDPESIRSLITEKTAAIIPVHLYGMPCDMDTINAIAEENGLIVVADAAQAHGATYKGKKAGSLAHAASFSFFPGKNLGALGDAGGVTSNDAELAKMVKLYANHGRESKFEHEFVGTNYRMDTLQAAVLIAKLAHLDEWIGRRRDLAAQYREYLSKEPFKGVVSLQEDTPGADSAWHIFAVRIENRDQVRTLLKEQGVNTGIHYPIPCHLQPALAPWSKGKGSLPVTEKVCGELISLPICPTMSDGDVKEIGEIFTRVVKAL